jgi:ABC-type sugar transport system substrate-binding protein
MNDRRYAMNVAVSDLAFWQEPRHTWEKIGSVVPGLEMMFGGPPDDDVSKQVQELEMLIAQGVSGLVVFSNDSRAVAPAIDRAIEKGIPVITAFSDVPTSKRIAHIGTDQSKLAEAIARQVKRDFRDRFQGKQPTVLISVGRRSSEDQEERLKGIRDEMGLKEETHLIVEDRFDPQEAEQVVLQAFSSRSDIDIIFGCNSQSAIGAVRALKKLDKRPGQVVVTGWDSEKEVMRQIQIEAKGGAGWIHATAVLYSSYMVQLCFALLEAENFGYLYPDTLNTRELRLPAVPERIEIPMKNVVTSRNVDEYLGKQ